MAGQRDLVPDRFLELVLYLVIHKRRRSRTRISSDLAYFYANLASTARTFSNFSSRFTENLRYFDSLPLLNVYLYEL